MPYTTLPGTRAPVKIWTDPTGIEPQAQQQLRNIGNLPYVDGVAVMPDVHYGKGATIGSVIAMRQALAPHTTARWIRSGCPACTAPADAAGGSSGPASAPCTPAWAG